MRKCALLLLASCLSVLSCKPKDSKDTSARTGGPTIKLARTRCKGSCPAYSVSADDKGVVTYDGQAYVKAFGRKLGQIDPGALKRLATELADKGFFTIEFPQSAKDCLKGFATDGASYELEMTAGGKHRAITYYTGNECAPKEVAAMASRIDEVLETKQWVECDGPCVESSAPRPKSSP